MLKRVRGWRISLAKKCLLLFGAAVLLIISASLYVPWQRMEQLMEQMNERTARTLADWAEADHVAQQVAAAAARAGVTLSTRPVVRDGGATFPEPTPDANADPTTRPSVARSFDKPSVRLVRFSKGDSRLDRFEQRAKDVLSRRPDDEAYFKSQRNEDAPQSFRYAKALVIKPSCVACHQVAQSRPAAEMTVTRDGGGAVEEAESKPLAPPLIGMVSIEIPFQFEAREAYLNRIFMFMAGFFAGLLAILVFYQITTKLILSPVRVLQETAEKVSKGDLNIRSDISTGDEFQQLAESNVALYESNRLKSEFLANVSHELRTPLNSILGFAELLRDAAGANGDAKATRYVQNIVTSGKNLLDLINDLLDLAKIEAGRMEVRSEPLSLVDLFEGLVGILKPLAEKKNLSVVPFVGRDVPIMHTDGAKLQQVLYNFLSNAIKFTPEGERIDLRAERVSEDEVRISVRDRGPGIPPEKQHLIFEKFRQLDGSVTRQHGGTGLGLSISKELGALLNGSIGLDSVPGEGATFWITLPVKIEARTQQVQLVYANK